MLWAQVLIRGVCLDRRVRVGSLGVLRGDHRPLVHNVRNDPIARLSHFFHHRFFSRFSERDLAPESAAFLLLGLLRGLDVIELVGEAPLRLT